MAKHTSLKEIDPDLTVGGRVASAFVSLFFSLPICGLLVLVLNYGLSSSSQFFFPFSTVLWLVGFMAGFAFVFPKAFPTLFGWLCNVVFAIGKYW